MSRDIPLPHPGSVLKEEILDPMGISVYALAKAIDVSRSRINDICRARQGISVAVALRPGHFFGVDPQCFMNIQSRYDLAAAKDTLAATLDRIEPHRPKAA